MEAFNLGAMRGFGKIYKNRQDGSAVLVRTFTNDIHRQNMLSVLTNALAHKVIQPSSDTSIQDLRSTESSVYAIGFGNGASTQVLTGQYVFRDPATVGADARLYNELFWLVIDRNYGQVQPHFVLNEDTVVEKIDDGVLSTVQCSVTFTAEDLIQAGYNENSFVIDEFALFTNKAGALMKPGEPREKGKLLTHAIFEPISIAFAGDPYDPYDPYAVDPYSTVSFTIVYEIQFTAAA